MFIIINTLKLKIFKRFKEYFFSCSAHLEDNELFNAFKIIRY